MTKTVAGVGRELIMYAIAQNLVRMEMGRAGAAQRVDPERISFVDALRAARARADRTRAVAPGARHAGATDRESDPRRPGGTASGQTPAEAVSTAHDAPCPPTPCPTTRCRLATWHSRVARLFRRYLVVAVTLK
jgi:hypothetical protein